MNSKADKPTSDAADHAQKDLARDDTPTLFERAAGALGDVAEQLGDIGEAIADKAVAAASSGASLASDAASAVVEAGADVYTGSRLESLVSYVGEGLDERGVFDAIETATDAVGDKIGQVTGKRLMEMLEEKLKLQDQYNDVLATKLAEALDRIAKLEARLTNGTR
jgi:hypothetical protein